MKEFRLEKVSLYSGIVISVLLIPFYGLGLILLASLLLRYKNTYITVNDKTVISHKGIFVKKKKEIVIKRIDAVQVDQGFMAKKLDYGNITFSLGSSNPIYRNVKRPNELKDLVEANF